MNESILSTFKESLERDPSADLSSLFKRYATSYPNRRAKWEKMRPSPNFRNDTSVPSKRIQDISQTPLETQTEATDRPSQVIVHQKLDPEVSAIIDTSNLDQFPSSDAPRFVSNFTEILQKGTTISQSGGKTIVLLENGIVVKHGLYMDCNEAHIMKYVQRISDNVPLPRPLGALSIGLRTYIFMTFIKGNPLDKSWSSLSGEHKHSIQNQLSAILEKLRSLPLPSPYLGGATCLCKGDVPCCKDTRRYTRFSQTPIRNETDFNKFLLSGTGPRYSRAYLQFLNSLLRTDHRVVMTHGDLHPRNIMVEFGTGAEGLVRITGLIDWEMSGAYPEYWEYVKALNTVSPIEEDDWSLFLPTRAIGHCAAEYGIDCRIDSLVA
ncbi:uncharacterized protein K452DRAFT_234699 [Aplosporella prunicola CBS 121167]|uniref:Aminoglycoside phosphotransferase domain-containing protein n=1 Tax=Aplosporella prunicola CBS 121167 TaxID=1176127 RepID=A0A6A6B6J1_9PEZI|nr:uncharacterized protein K452DRAFT_234699 [Aplosporella prunicola CBS 121167]KAF2138401.1 hypothetical protein K452DRAFT_234699 [Aplosporella prunicola CBS 121167]